MKNTDRIYRQYLRNIRKYIPNAKGRGTTALSLIQQDIGDFRAEHPDAIYDDFVEYFGSPESIAASYVRDFPEEQQKHRSRTKKILTAAGIFVCTLVLAFILYFLDEISSSHVHVVYELRYETAPIRNKEN